MIARREVHADGHGICLSVEHALVVRPFGSHDISQDSLLSRDALRRVRTRHACGASAIRSALGVVRRAFYQCDHCGDGGSVPLFAGSARKWQTVARALGLHHATTRADVVRAYLFFKEGDICSDVRVSESARVLRSLPFLGDATARITLP